MRLAALAALPAALALAFPLALPAPAAAEAEWTFMYYVAADNDLARAAFLDVNELEAAPENPAVNAIVALDVSDETYSDGANEWDGMKVVRIRPDADPVKITSPVLKSYGRVNTGDPKLLRAFVEFAAAEAPAKRYCLVIWNHGTGWKTIPYADDRAGIAGELFGGAGASVAALAARSIAYDDVSRDSLTLKELGDALAASSRRALGRPFDLVLFDACLMQMAEVVDAVAPSARFILASEEVTPDAGYRHDRLLERAGRLAARDAGEMGRALLDLFVEGYLPPERPMPATLSLVDASRADPLAAALAAFARAAGRPEHAAALRAALDDAKKFHFADYVDLDHYVTLAAANVESPEVARTAAALRAALAALVAGKRSSHEKFAPCGGLSIYFPSGPVDPAYRELPFAVKSGWLAFLELVLESRDGVRVECADAWVEDDGGDGRLAEAEPAAVVCRVVNRGREALAGGRFILRPANPRVKVETAEVADRSLAPGASLDLSFRVVSSAAAGAHEAAPFTLHLERDGARALVGRLEARVAPPFPKRASLLLVADRADAALEMVEAACAQAGFACDVWRIAQEGPLTRRALETYRGAAVVRLLPENGPGYQFTPEEDARLSSHVANGGRLLVTGQDFAHRYAPGALCSAFGVWAERDDAESESLAFADGSLAFALNGQDSADNQMFPDALAARGAAPCIRYTGAGGAPAGAAAFLGEAGRGGGRCLFLGFGLEGVAGTAMRGEVLRRCLDLLAVRPAEAVAKVAADRADEVLRSGFAASVAEELAAGRAGRARAFLESALRADPETRAALARDARSVVDWARGRAIEESAAGARPDPDVARILELSPLLFPDGETPPAE